MTADATNTPRVPDSLRRAVEDDLRPVPRLASPERRALMTIPLGILLLAAAPVLFGVRADAPRLGFTLSWAASTLQIIVGLSLIGAALREAVPGRTLSSGVLMAAVGVGLGAVLAITAASWIVSPVVIDRGSLQIGLICFGGAFISAAPVVIIAGLLAARAFPVRPAIAGALYGLGGGLMADAGWRLFCEFSDPAHVLPAHLGGVLAAMAFGTLTGKAIDRYRREKGEVRREKES